MGPKIFVFHVSQIIKVATFVIIGLIVLFSLIFYFTNSQSNQSAAVHTQENAGKYNPGTYRARVHLNYQPLYVEVTVTEDEILSIVFEELTENQMVFYPLLEPTIERLTYEILENQSLLAITSTDDDMVTSQVVFSAIHRAVEEARAEMDLDFGYVQDIE